MTTSTATAPSVRVAEQYSVNATPVLVGHELQFGYPRGVSVSIGTREGTKEGALVFQLAEIPSSHHSILHPATGPANEAETSLPVGLRRLAAIHIYGCPAALKEDGHIVATGKGGTIEIQNTSDATIGWTERIDADKLKYVDLFAAQVVGSDDIGFLLKVRGTGQFTPVFVSLEEAAELVQSAVSFAGTSLADAGKITISTGRQVLVSSDDGIGYFPPFTSEPGHGGPNIFSLMGREVELGTAPSTASRLKASSK